MRPFRLAAVIAAAFLGAWLAAPAGTTTLSTFAIADAQAQAGSAVVFTIRRTSGSGPINVLFQTADLTAKAGPDYLAIKKLVYFKGGQSSAQVEVPTSIDLADLGKTLQFSVAIAASKAGAATARGSIIEPPAPQPAPNSWVSAPLQDGGFARVKNASDSLWPITGPGSGRPLVNGEIVAVYFNGWGYQADGQASFAIYALSDGTSGRALASDLEGVAPSGSPPALPADWWVPGLVKASKTCGSATQPGQPGVVEGGIYRAAMLAGSHMKLADGQTSAPPIMWLVFATGVQQFTTGEVVVTGDCLVGISSAAP
jgi:hypothetical protein